MCERDWKHTTMGVASGWSTRDFCCQACGHRFTLAPMQRITVFAVMGVLLSWTCVLLVIGGGWAALLYWPYLANPVVPDAPLPVMAFSAAEPTRKCAKCGGIARCRSVTHTTSSGMSTGTDYDYDYVRGKCGGEFTIESWGGLAFNLFGATFCFLLGFGCMPAGLLLWLLSLGLLLMSGFRILARVRNPLIAEEIRG